VQALILPVPIACTTIAVINNARAPLGIASSGGADATIKIALPSKYIKMARVMVLYRPQ
jgi:hypothetical protein